METKYILVAIIAPVVLFVGTEFASYILNLFFDQAFSHFPSVSNIIKNKKREEFYKVTTSAEYKTFAEKFMEHYYGKDFFTDVEVNNEIISYPVYLYKASDAISNNEVGIRRYDSIMDIKDCTFDEKNHQDYKKKRYYKQYHNIVGRNIKGPDRPGYMLDEFQFNEGHIEKIKVHVGSYAENVYSTHVLEYEMFKLFKKFKNVTDDNWEKIRKSAQIRNKIHEGVKPGDVDSMKESLSKCVGRDSLLGVQMLVLMKNNDGHYQLKIIERSKDVAIAPGIFQLVPSGGFEILNDSEPGYSEHEIKDNLSPGCAVFREYLEELFGFDEFEGRGKGSVNEALLKNPRIKELEDMIKNKSAWFSFLGSVIDLNGLRHELSFALVIEDAKYEANNQFLGNDEAASRSFVSGITIDNFEQHDEIWRKLHGPSAVMWKMFKDTEKYRQLT